MKSKLRDYGSKLEIGEIYVENYKGRSYSVLLFEAVNNIDPSFIKDEIGLSVISHVIKKEKQQIFIDNNTDSIIFTKKLL